MGEHEVLALAQDMTITREEFLRSLPGAVAGVAFEVDGDELRHCDGERAWRIALSRLPDLRLGQIALSRHRVELRLSGFDAEATRSFLARFELYYRRGGG